MARYWAMRTSKDNANFIFKELKKERLRQGWGYRVDQNLDEIRKALSEKRPLNEDQKVCWRGNRRMHPEEWDSIQKGDYIILPNLPDIGQWSVAKVTGGYRYQIDTNLGDFGHILEVKMLNPENHPINPYNQHVSANLRKTMNTRSRLWNIDWYKSDVKKLITAIKEGKDLSKPTKESEKISGIYSKLTKTLERELRDKYYGSEFEVPIKKLLEKIYQNVEGKAGSREKGADFICSFNDGLGVPHKIAVQVKMWEGEARWLRPLEQIKEAYNNYEEISAGVIITTSESFSTDFEKKKTEFEKELNIPIVMIDKRWLANVFLKYFPEFVESVVENE